MTWFSPPGAQALFWAQREPLLLFPLILSGGASPSSCSFPSACASLQHAEDCRQTLLGALRLFLCVALSSPALCPVNASCLGLPTLSSVPSTQRACWDLPVCPLPALGPGSSRQQDGALRGLVSLHFGDHCSLLPEV